MAGDERTKQARENLVKMMLADMEREGMNWSRSWCAGEPFNPVTGTHYSGRNALLLTYYMREEHMTDPRFMTFRQAKDKGCKIAKGCHSFAIEKWRELFFDASDKSRKVKQPRNEEERRALLDDPNIESRWVVVGHHSVFNARDIEGIAPYETARGLEGAELLDFLEENSPCPVREQMQDAAFYMPQVDRIAIPARAQFENLQSACRVLLHEQTHATGHPSRLGRDQSGDYGSAEYAFEELVAELGSLFTANALGVTLPEIATDGELAKSDYWSRHVAYIKSWARSCEGEGAEEIIFRAASKAGKAADYLLSECFTAERRERAAKAA